MRSRTNSFLVNLSIADLGMAIFNCAPSFIFMRDRLETFLQQDFFTVQYSSIFQAMGVWIILLFLLPVQLIPHHQPVGVHLAWDNHGALQGHHDTPCAKEQPNDLTKEPGHHLGGQQLHLLATRHFLQACANTNRVSCRIELHR